MGDSKNERALGHVVDGPTPDQYGNARFTVEVGDRRVPAFADICGAGVVDDGDLDVFGAVANAISSFKREHPAAFHACVQDAARLRRAAGHPSPIEVPVPETIAIAPTVDVRPTGARFTVRIASSAVRVIATRDGALVDDYDPTFHPDGEIDPENLAAAHRAVLNFILAHPERAPSWNLDCDTLDLLWNR